MDSIADRTTSLDFAGVRALAADDMKEVDALIRHRLSSDVVLINAIADHIIAGGGKRLRPMLHVLAARAAGYDGQEHAKLAAIIEFIHTSTLLHDDVVDESDMRRGRKTANALWGNAASVLVGDFLYSRSFQLMVELDDTMVAIARSLELHTIAEGIETEAQHDFLLRAGCQEAQGFLYSRPLPPDEIERLLAPNAKTTGGTRLSLVPPHRA